MSGRETDPQLAPILGVDAEDHIIRALYATDKITDPIFELPGDRIGDS
jgi:hypothetical protein